MRLNKIADTISVHEKGRASSSSRTLQKPDQRLKPNALLFRAFGYRKIGRISGERLVSLDAKLSFGASDFSPLHHSLAVAHKTPIIISNYPIDDPSVVNFGKIWRMGWHLQSNGTHLNPTYKVGFKFAVSSNNTLVAAFAYDTQGRRVKKVAADGTHRYFYDGQLFVYEHITRPDNTVSEIDYVWGNDISGTRDSACGIGKSGVTPFRKMR